MADAASVESRVGQILSAQLNLDVPSVDTDLFETAAVDSLAFVELLLHLEREFGIKVSLDDLEIDNFRTIRRVAQFVMARNGQERAAG